MTTTLPANSSVEVSSSANLESFFEQLLGSNPFVLNRVLQPATMNADARDIHQAAFRQLVELAKTAGSQRLGIGAMLLGEAGVGKSHVLARLSEWAAATNEALFVYFHNLQARAETLPRYLLKCVVSTLTAGHGPYYQETPFLRLVNKALKTALDQSPSAVGRSPSWAQVESAYQHWLDHLLAQDPARAALIDRTIFDVLLRFCRSAHRAIHLGQDDGLARPAVLWLSGEALDSESAHRLGLPLAPGSQGTTALRDDQQIKQVLLALAQMAWLRGQPLLLCFDQVDNLEKDQVAALARFLQGLLDSTPNLLVVTSGVQATLRRFHSDHTIQQSAWDRLAQFEVHLQRVSAREAAAIVKARLDQFVEPFLDIEPMRHLVRDDQLFPLGKAWFDEVFRGKNDIRPRDVITWAREGWQRQQVALRKLGGSAWLSTWGGITGNGSEDELTEEELIDRKVEQKVAEATRQREAEPVGLPPDAENLVGLVRTLLNQCVGVGREQVILEVKSPRPGRRPYQLLIRQRRGPEGPEETTGLLFVVTESANSAGAQLRKAAQDSQPPQRVFLITDERRPLTLGVQGEAFLDQLQKRPEVHFQPINLTFAQYAGLQALQDVVAMARAGDLELDGLPGHNRPITEAEVIASYHRQHRYRTNPPLRELFRSETPPGGKTIPTDGSGESGTPFIIDETDGRSFVLAQLALSSGESSVGLADKYSAYLRKIKGMEVAPSQCQAGLEALAQKMHQEGLIQVAALEDGLFLSLK